MRLKLFLSVLLFCGITNAQTNTELKDFINKNNVALRAVQKNMLYENNTSFSEAFKEILKNQVASVKLYQTDKKASVYFSFLVRKTCLEYLKAHKKGSTDFFEISEQEKGYAISENETNSKVLSTGEVKVIQDSDVMNPQNLNNLILTIQ